ncbi:MAG TPA: flagellar motor protein MotB [Bdellovibrionales bacterium]|nr:MAG: hypothetical protein A2Z97_10155 [Bdellovibrionales bacterium GWB1_52_6]OFZ05280.1 MAG: hypothetical protein A2X97_10865 [Bdellovibrionales bacterium GWA1_52_35]OFZ42166.1 MAG: hypothetical protein A2070_07545 [Bdellovibrionales bacterium GWC1_52_8]HAR43927.1 flagellar motor protein MotB [Bdellovibrionales bacterium]HCM38582.1 flagellar motor protein MotB [Bdellovibrionales bacterium]
MALRKLLKIPKLPIQKKTEKPHAPAAHDESNWLVSYADMMTLLCGFFIMLFSMSKMDDPQFERVKESVAKQFGGGYTSPTEDLAQFITQVLDDQGKLKEAVIQADVFGISIAFQSTLFFDTLSSEVKSEGKQVLEKLITSVADKQIKDEKKYRIIVEGHTDSRPIVGGVYPSNWELSGARAARVVRMFLDQGFSADHLTAIGYADTYPQFPSRTPAGEADESSYAKNRRVVIRILQPKVESMPFPEPAKDLAPAPANPEVSAH